MKRRKYPSYQAYLKHQVSKTADRRVRRRVRGFWDRDRGNFRTAFHLLDGVARKGGRGICLGARLGCEVEVLRGLEYANSIGIDLVACPPLVVEGDFHDIPFGDGEFDFAFSNSVDHVFDLGKLAAEISRVLRPEAVVLLHLALRHLCRHESAYLESAEEVIEAFADFRLLRQGQALEGENLVAVLLVRP